MRRIFLLFFLFFFHSVQTRVEYDFSLATLIQKKNLFTCLSCGKQLTWQDLMWNKDLLFELDISGPYCRRCLEAMQTRPYPSLPSVTPPPASFDYETPHAFLMWKDKHVKDIWNLDDEDSNQLSCTVLGWHFRMKKGSNLVYVYDPNDAEYQSHVDIDVVELQSYDWGIIVKDSKGNERMFDLRHLMWGLGSQEKGTPTFVMRGLRDDGPDADEQSQSRESLEKEAEKMKKLNVRNKKKRSSLLGFLLCTGCTKE